MPDKLLSPSIGLLNTDLQKANADPSNVKAGLTFYSGDKTLKTGTLQDLGSEPRATGGTLYNNGVYFYIGENAGQGRYIVQRGVYWDYGSVANLIGLTADKIRSGQQILGISGTFSGNPPTIKYAGRIWANGYANGSGYNTTDFSANNQYCTGEKGTYDARIRAKVSGQFAVYIQRNNSGPEFKSKWFNAGEELAWVGPSTYGNAQVYYVSL